MPLPTSWSCVALHPFGHEVLAGRDLPPPNKHLEGVLHECVKRHLPSPHQGEKLVILYERCSRGRKLDEKSGVHAKMAPSFKKMKERGMRPVIVIAENGSGMADRKERKREGLATLVEIAKATGLTVVVWEYDRLTRNPESIGWLLSHHIRYRSLTESGSVDSVLVVASMKARKEGLHLREMGRKGQEALVASGKDHIRLGNLEKGRGKGHETRADRQRQDALDCGPDMERAIRALLDETPIGKAISLGRIAEWLNNHGHKTGTGGRYSTEQLRRYMKHLPRLKALRSRELVEEPVTSTRKRSADSSVAAPAGSSAAARRCASPDPKSPRKPARRRKRPKLISLDAGLDCWRVPQSHYLGGEERADDVRASAIEVSPSFESGSASAGTERLSPSSTSIDISGAKDAPEKPAPASSPRASSSKVLDVIRRVRESEWELCEYPSGTWSPGPGSYRRKRPPPASKKAL
ncbi:recombinase family protein [Oceanibaculum nanhaiense]|uniref:recombinase family protein n=1 Tax=Oceanibaculum nanhaiense TaxID=1909734 RepID=UPI003D2C719C